MILSDSIDPFYGDWCELKFKSEYDRLLHKI